MFAAWSIPFAYKLLSEMQRDVVNVLLFLYITDFMSQGKKKVNESFILLTKILYFSLLFQTRFLGF